MAAVLKQYQMMNTQDSATPGSPPRTLLDKARQMADLKGKSVYLYKEGDNWCLGESLGMISNCSRILEVKPRTDEDSETDNFGGC